MEEMYRWYKIPGFASYDINYYTREVRSCKHFNVGFHIMKQDKKNRVTIIDDYGNSQKMDVNRLFDITFNCGNKLEPRGEWDMYRGGMQRINRKKAGSKYADPGRVTLTFGPNGIGTKPNS